MDDGIIHSIRETYDRLAEEYARRIFNELQHKPLDRELLDRFAAALAGRGDICDMGCGPGHVTRYLRDAGATVFGLDFFPRGKHAGIGAPGWEPCGNRRLLCHREYPPQISASRVSRNGESAATGRIAVARVSRGRRNHS